MAPSVFICLRRTNARKEFCKRKTTKLEYYCLYKVTERAASPPYPSPPKKREEREQKINQTNKTNISIGNRATAPLPTPGAPDSPSRRPASLKNDIQPTYYADMVAERKPFVLMSSQANPALIDPPRHVIRKRGFRSLLSSHFPPRHVIRLQSQLHRLPMPQLQEQERSICSCREAPARDSLETLLRYTLRSRTTKRNISNKSHQRIVNSNKSKPIQLCLSSVPLTLFSSTSTAP